MKVALYNTFSSDHLIREGSSHDRHLERNNLHSKLFTSGQKREKRALKSVKQQLIIHREEFTQGN